MTRLLVLLVLLSCFVACTAPGQAPPFGPNDPVIAEEPWPEVAPEIASWFRATRPSDGDKLIVDDQIEIRIQGRPEYDIQRVIPSDGVVPLYKADVPSVVARGRTPVELEKLIAAAYAEKFNDPYVTVGVVSRAPRYVYVSGQVTSESRVEMEGEGLNVMKAITLAGGASDDADLRHVTVRRFHAASDQEVSSPPLDLSAVYAGRDQTDNLYLAHGDTVIVPKAAKLRVHVFGHVETPSAVPWFDGMTLAMAVTECGGFKRFARTSKIKIVRRGLTAVQFNFEAVMAGTADDVKLLPGDRVFVPESPL